MRSSAALLLAVVGSASAQFSNGLNYTTSGPLNVTASQIPLSLRSVWCNSQTTICRALCGDAKVNNCDVNNFAYDCQCAKGTTPNISSYENTLPWHICTYWQGNCVDNHPNDLAGITACRSVVCGKKMAPTNSMAAGASSTTSHSHKAASHSATSKTAASAGSQSTSSSSTASSGNMAAATQFAASYGTQLLAGGMLAAFGLAL